MPQKYIVSHTSMRGVAALLVVFYHLQFGAEALFGWESATPFFRKGYLWVDLFFILSGFVISYSARADERAPYSWTEVKRFYVQRFARIYPLHFVALFLLLAVLAAQNFIARFTTIGVVDPDFGSTMSILSFFEQLFLLNAWGFTGIIGWNIPSWSISAEAFAYAVFPLLAAMIVRWRTPGIAALIAAAALFYAWVALTTGVLDIVKVIAPLRCLAGFSLGMVIYAWRGPIGAWGDPALGVLQAIGLAAVLVTLLLGLNDVLAIPGFFLLVAATLADRGWLAALLKARVLHWLGVISYSIYLNHFWILSGWHFVMERALPRLGLDPLATRAVIMAGGIALILAISHATYLLIEGPARAAILRRWTRHQTRAEAAALPAAKEPR